jgi:hypothetical protein
VKKEEIRGQYRGDVESTVRSTHWSNIDGNHRIEKARRSGIEFLMAYRVNADRHIKFMTTRKAYVAHVEYWNGKLKDLRKDENGSAAIRPS